MAGKVKRGVESSSSQAELLTAVRESTRQQAEALTAYREIAAEDRAFRREMTDAMKDVSTAMRALAAFDPDAKSAKAKRRASREVEGEMPPATNLHAPAPLAPETHVPASNVRSFKQGRHEGLHGIRHDITHAVSRHLAQKGQVGYHQIEVPADHPAGIGSIIAPEDIPEVAEGMATKILHRNQATGEIVSEGAFNKGMRTMARGQKLRDMVQHFEEGGTLEGAVGKMLPKVGKTIGEVGIAVGVADEIGKKFQEQAEANRPFQEVLGGSNWGTGFRERFNQNLFRIKNKFSFNPLSDRDSETIYQGAMELYAGDSHMRGVAQNQAVSLLRGLGMDPAETMKLFQTAAKAGTEGISQISESLRDVTKAARAAGMNAKEARDRFSDAYTQISKSVSGGSGILMAAAQSQVLTSFGHQFQDVSFDNGINQDIWTSMMTGKSLGAIAADKNTTGGAQRYLQSQRQRRISAIQGLFGNKANEIVNKYTSKMKPGKQFSLDTQQEMANDLLRETGLDPSVIASAMSSLGGMQGLNRDNAAMGVIKELIPGGDTTEKTAQDQIDKYSEKPEGGDLPKDWTDFRSATKWIQDALGYGSGGAQNLWTHLKDSGPGGVTGKDRAAWLYIQQLRKSSGRRSPIMERLIREYDSGRRYRVTSKGGKEHVVGNFELITGGFLDQVNSGHVQIVKGEGAGGDLAKLVGVAAADLPGYGTTPESTGNDYTGKNFDSDKNTGGPAGTITVKAAPELQRWIQLQGTDGTTVTTDGYPASGMSSPSTYPTGN